MFGVPAKGQIYPPRPRCWGICCIRGSKSLIEFIFLCKTFTRQKAKEPHMQQCVVASQGAKFRKFRKNSLKFTKFAEFRKFRKNAQKKITKMQKFAKIRKNHQNCKICTLRKFADSPLPRAFDVLVSLHL